MSISRIFQDNSGIFRKFYSIFNFNSIHLGFFRIFRDILRFKVIFKDPTDVNSPITKDLSGFLWDSSRF